MTFSPLAAEELDARPDRLVAAARELASETGSAAFTVAQVTARAGLSLKSFYRCFPSKDDLLLDLIAADSRIGADLLAQLIGDRTGDAAVYTYVTELFAMLSLPGAAGYAGVLVREHRRLVEAHDARQRAALAPLVDLLASHLDTPDPWRDAETMFSILLTGIHDVVIRHTGDARAVGEYLYRFCMHGAGH